MKKKKPIMIRLSYDEKSKAFEADVQGYPNLNLYTHKTKLLDIYKDLEDSFNIQIKYAYPSDFNKYDFVIFISYTQ